jgi:diguanylate cyclase (GGDEF)-like protein
MELTSLGRRPKSFLLACLFVVLVIAVELASVLLVNEEQYRRVISDVTAVVLDSLACVALFIAARRSYARSTRTALAWGLMALGSLSFAFGDIAWAILELVLKVEPFPSIADAFYIGYYPLVLGGVLLLTAKPLSTGESVNKAIDIGIVLLAAVVGVWKFLLAPSMLSSAGESQLVQFVLLAYPVGDLVLLAALLVVTNNRSSEVHDSSILFLAGSMLFTIVPDVIYAYESLQGTYASGGLLDIGWDVSTLLLGLAGISWIIALERRDAASTWRLASKLLDRLTPLWTFAPYVAMLGAYVLLFGSSSEPLTSELAALSWGVVCLVIAKQAIGMIHNRRLNSRLYATNRELEFQLTERDRVAERLSYDALHDPLTGLANRTLFLERLGHILERSKRKVSASGAVLFIDLDQFKVFNDSLGHLIGDELLVLVARRLEKMLRSGDTVARFGGDEFEVLLDDPIDREIVLAVAGRIRAALLRPFDLKGREIFLSASIGVVLGSAGYERAEEMLRDADIAMYAAKKAGRDRYEIFDVGMRDQAVSRLQLENEMRAGLERREFQVFYQPIVRLETNRLAGFEALVRWQHPGRGLLPPSEFLPVAEESGLIVPIGDWVINEACRQFKTWQEKNPILEDAGVSVNISSKQFSHPNFADKVVQALQQSGLRASALRLEITETVLINNFGLAKEVFTKLRNLGIESQIDDFGTGYSALGYLQQFPIDALKIDRSFVSEIPHGHKGTELVRAIISMARELGMATIAEGIETTSQLSELKDLSCGYGQGYLLSKPLDVNAVEAVLADAVVELPSAAATVS